MPESFNMFLIIMGAIMALIALSLSISYFRKK